MNQSWKVTAWGVRGSYPVPETNYMKYGGNTSCISIECGEKVVVFDAGSGLIKLGNFLEQKGIKRVDILISHLHLDHCLGLFGFQLFHDPDAEIHLYGRAHEGIGLEKSLRMLIGPPYWPLSLKDFPAHVEIHEIEPGQTFRLAGNSTASDAFTVRALEGNHPNQSLYYRLESCDKSVIYALDCEMNDQMEKTLTRFAENGNLLIWDANFTEESLSQRRGWGHSTWNQGIALRRAAGVKAALMTHFSSEYDDAFLKEQEELCSMEDPASRFAREGMEISII